MTRSFERSVVGSAGFVGESLLHQSEFDGQFHRGNFDELRGSSHDLLIFASAPAKKWLANASPGPDRANIDYLVESMRTVSVKKFVLVSTVDVFSNPIGVDENFEADAVEPNHYGVNRLHLEHRLREIFPSMLVVRLPGLVGDGLKKNAVFDLKHANEVEKLNGASRFQFYPMKHLMEDIEIGIRSGLPLLHLSSEPVLLSDVGREVFEIELLSNRPSASNYDFQSVFASLWGKGGSYQYSREESLASIREYRMGV